MGEFQQTSTIIKDNLNPTWLETFRFLTNKMELNDQKLIIKCFDHDNISHDFLGQVTIPLANNVGEDIRDIWLPFEVFFFL